MQEISVDEWKSLQVKQKRPGQKRATTEADFQNALIKHAQLNGWKVASFRPARVIRNGVEKYETPVGAAGKGWPDLVMLKGSRLLVVECKSGKNKPSEAQEVWLECFRQVTPEVYVFYPKDLDFAIEVLSKEV